MGKPITWLKGSRGLNNRIHPLRVTVDPETGIQDLAIAYNIDHDATGRISRRRGWEATAITASCHSLWCDGIDCLFVTGDALCVLGSDFTYNLIRQVTEDARMSYARVENRVYYANGSEVGFVMNGLSYSWELPPIIPGPSTERVFTGPPIGSLLAYYRGRMYVVSGRVAWYSEPFGIHLFDPPRNFVAFESGVRMIRPVKEGIFIGTDTNTLFLRGTEPKEFMYEKIATYPPIEGTDVEIDASKVGDGSIRGIAVVWTSEEGICLGTEEGKMINLTERRLVYPKSIRGAGLYLGDRYLSVLEP
jgi:hypothetical protein